VLIVNRGKIVADGSPDDLAARSGKVRYVMSFSAKALGDNKAPKDVAEVLEAAKRVTSEATVKALTGDEKEHVVEVLAPGGGDARAEFFRLAVDKGWVLLELRREAMQLEEVFRQLTVGEGVARRNETSKKD
jgi:ABC-2 type transport system ATP-binding protein